MAAASVNMVRCSPTYTLPCTQIMNETFNIPATRSVPVSVATLHKTVAEALNSLTLQSKVGLSPFWKSDVLEETAEVEKDCSFDDG